MYIQGLTVTPTRVALEPKTLNIVGLQEDRSKGKSCADLELGSDDLVGEFTVPVSSACLGLPELEQDMNFGL